VSFNKKTFAYGAASVVQETFVQRDGYFIQPQRGNFLLGTGVGGADHGASICKQTLKKMQTDLLDRSQSLPSVFMAAHQSLWNENQGKPMQERSALSLLGAFSIGDGNFDFVQVGGGSVALFRGGIGSLLVYPQVLSSESQRFPLQLLGMQAEIFPKWENAQLNAGDILLLASQGIGTGVDFFSHCQNIFSTRNPGESLESSAAQLLQQLQGSNLVPENGSLLLLEYC
jgi:hypothetical protein